MTPRDPARRRFLAASITAVGVAVAAPIIWAMSRAGVTTPSTTLGASPSTSKPPGTTTTAAASISTAPPATTTAPPETTTTAPPETTATTVLGDVPVSIEAICVAGWGGQPAQSDFQEHVIERLTIHHTASRLDDNARAPDHIRGHQRFHQRDRGWPDLAYHFIVDRNGHVYEGRPLWARGDTGTNYDPTGHFLVCCEGNFDEQPPSAAQVQSLVAMLGWASVEFGVDPETMRGHRDLAATSCPGTDLYAFLQDGSLLSSVRKVVASGAPRLSIVCGAEAATRVDNIEAGVL